VASVFDAEFTGAFEGEEYEKYDLMSIPNNFMKKS
jgi:hypothetical protein